MNPRSALIAYFRDLAAWNTDIGHTTAAPHFFQGTEYQAIIGKVSKPQNAGWNLIFAGYITKGRDNGTAHWVDTALVVFQVIKQVPRNASDTDDLGAVYDAAYLIGEEIIRRIHQHVKDPCSAEVSDGITVPYHIDINSKRATEVGPLFDNFHGYEFAVDIQMAETSPRAIDPTKWSDPT